MKKILIIAIIAVIAVLNFSLVANKSGNASLKSFTTLAKANACDEEPVVPVGTSKIIFVRKDSTIRQTDHASLLSCPKCSKNRLEYYIYLTNVTTTYDVYAYQRRYTMCYEWVKGSPYEVPSYYYTKHEHCSSCGYEKIISPWYGNR